MSCEVPYIEQSVPPAAPLLSTSDAKSFLRVSSSSEDGLIASLVAGATLWIENLTALPLRQVDWHCFYDAFDDPLLVPIARVQSVRALHHLVDGSFVAVATGTSLRRRKVESYVSSAAGETWPTNTDDEPQSVRLEVRAVATAAEIALGTEAVKRIVANLYADRGDMEKVATMSLPGTSANAILMQNAAAQSGAAGLMSTITANLGI